MSAVEGMGIITGGMEFPMMTLMGGYNGRGAGDLYNVTAHELAHMWIPMSLSTNERRYAWIDEGTTTFNEAEAREDFFPDNGVQPHVGDQQSYINAVLAGVEAPILRWSDYHYSSPAYGVASYPKPGALWQALRGIMGEEDFLDAYRAFYDAWAGKHPTPYDLFNFFEAAHGEDLDWFWDSFYEETWSLDHAVESVENTENGVRITVRDEGSAVMPVDLTLTLENGETLERRVPVAPWLRGQREARLTVQTSAPVERVEIDAGRYYPDTDREDNVWTR
jgi:aminopeptidase N